MAYEEKFRRRVRVREYKDSGHTFIRVYEAFSVRLRSYYTWKAELKKGKFENRYPKTRKGKIDTERLGELAKKHPDWYLREFVEDPASVFRQYIKCLRNQALPIKKLSPVQKKTGKILTNSSENHIFEAFSLFVMKKVV
jgi:hypothetical protein